MAINTYKIAFTGAQVDALLGNVDNLFGDALSEASSVSTGAKLIINDGGTIKQVDESILSDHVIAQNPNIDLVADNIDSILDVVDNLPAILGATNLGTVPFEGTAATGISFTKGQIGQITVSGIVKANATSESTAKGTLVIAKEDITSGGTGNFLLLGTITGLSGLIDGADYYLGLTDGSMGLSQIWGNGNVSRFIGTAQGTDTFFFNPSSLYTVTTVSNVPEQPTNLTATAGANSVFLDWDEPSNTGGVVITDYKVEYKLTADSTWSTFSHTASTDSAITVTGLTNNSSYDFRVSAINVIGTGTASSTATKTPIPASDIESIITSGMELFLDGKTYSGSGTWNNQIGAPDSGAAQSAYNVTPTNVALWDSNKWVMNNTGYFTFASNSTFLNSLHKTTAGTEWTMFMMVRSPTSAAKIDTIFSTISATAGDYGIELRVDSSGNLKIDQRNGVGIVSNTLASAGIVADTDYVIVVAYDYATNTHYYALNADTFTTSTSFGWTDSITHDATYTATIAANGAQAAVMDSGANIYAIGFVDSVITNTQLASLREFLTANYTASSASVPDQVTGLIVTPGDTSANLSWTAPSDGGSSITDYKVEYKLTADSVWTEYVHTASTSPNIQIIGIVNGSSYDFRVSAINAIGTGTASSTGSGTPVATGTDGDPYDESTYKLTLPVNSSGGLTGSAIEINQPALLTYEDTWFQRPGDGTFRFTCPDGGAVTDTATYSRCELRQLSNLAYNYSSEDTLDVAVLSIPNGYKTVIHQIHGVPDPWFKTVYLGKDDGSGYIYTLIKKYAGAADTKVTLKTNVAYGDRTKLRVVYTGSALAFYVDDSLIHTETISYTSGTYYWKRGNYFQSVARNGATCTVAHYTNANNFSLLI